MPYPDIKPRTLRSLTLELSLRPFIDTSDAGVRSKLREMFRQWRPLTLSAESVSVMMWTSDGSEILDFTGDLEQTFEWSYTIGTANPHVEKNDPNDPENISIHRHTYKYVEKPAVHNYRWLKRFVELVREVGKEELNLPIQVGTTFDPGPEFALSKFKYQKHPEICLGGTMGHASFVVCYATLHADKERYAGFPNGIPEGTLLGTFLGRQSQHFLKAMNFDYLWLSNGFGFGLETWGMYGAVFNGKEFSPTKAQEVKEKSLLFFDSFRKECPDILLRTRGTNQTTGRDLASDGVPLREIYRNQYKLEPPPNSPWAALNGDFGLELVGWMSHIAEIPGKTYPFRFYIHDLWFVNSPWLDRYGREPHDIHLPLSVSRLDADGRISLPTDFNLLTVDDTYGRMPEIVPNEVIPHLTENLLTSPDAPGLLTWIYPFDEYHDMALDASRIAEVFFGDWFVRTAVGNGLPINTVTSTANARSIFFKNPSQLKGTILVAPAALGPDISKALVSFVENGGQVMFYGPTVFADAKIQDMLGVKQGAPVSGECEITLKIDGDLLSGKKAPTKIAHEELSSGGGLTEVSSSAEVLATVRSKDATRVFAVSRKDPKWKGGAATWVRGTNSFALPAFKGAHLPEMRDADAFFYSELLMRYAMRVFGFDLRLQKKHSSQRNPVLTVSRHRNAFYLAGFSPNTNVGQALRFPDGAPLPLGLETEIADGRSVFHFPKAWRRECRVFVDAQETQEVSCHEQNSGMVGVFRRFMIRGLKNADVTFFPETGSEGAVKFLRNPSHPFLVGDFLKPVRSDRADGTVLKVSKVTGDLLISW